jgi:DnaJ-class molecular chaperone
MRYAPTTGIHLFTLKNRRISLKEALCGTELHITHLDGRQLTYQVNDVIHHGAKKHIQGEGMPISKRPGSKGDLVLVFHVQFPTHLTQDQKSKLKQVL